MRYHPKQKVILKDNKITKEVITKEIMDYHYTRVLDKALSYTPQRTLDMNDILPDLNYNELPVDILPEVFKDNFPDHSEGPIHGISRSILDL